MEFIPIANPVIGEEEAKAVYDVVKSGWISMGKKVKEFEQAVCDYTGSKYALAMNNGTSTLHAILLALGIGPGDEVIVPSLTYISSANVVLYTGATPVLCENNPITFNVDPEHVKEKITDRTKAFMTVDLKGMPVDFDAFNALSEETGIPFISDSAESFGAKYKGGKIGTQALTHSFSFFANKNITTGEGGVITTDDETLYKKISIIRNQGQEGRYNHTMLGNNYRMTDISAAFGIEQLKRVDWLLGEKEKLAFRYNKIFQEYDFITEPYLPDYVSRHSWYMYSICVEKSKRDPLLEYLEKEKIETRLSFPPVHIQPYYEKTFGYKPEDIPMAYDIFCKFIDIPIWAEMGVEKQDIVVEKILSFFNNII